MSLESWAHLVSMGHRSGERGGMNRPDPGAMAGDTMVTRFRSQKSSTCRNHAFAYRPSENWTFHCSALS